LCDNLQKNLQASVGNGGLKSWKNGPGGAVLATFPPGKFGAAVDIGVSLGPEVAATEAVVQATNLDTPPNQQVFNEPG
jgi:hypothetical protein